MMRRLTPIRTLVLPCALLLVGLAAGPAAAICGDGILDPGEMCDDANLVAGDCCDPLCMFEVGPGTPPCCSMGICKVAAPCGTACFGTPLFCNYTGPPPALCTCNSLPPAPPLEHYRMYPSQGSVDPPAVTLRDQFLTQTTDPGPPAFFLPPAWKNFEGSPELYGPHLTCYPLPLGDAQFHAAVTIRNQFGQQQIEVRNPELLCVPTEKFVPPGPIPGVLDHFQCYQATGGPPTLLPVIVQDQFQIESAVPILDPFLFCNPVDKNGEGIERPLDHLTCYQTISAGLPPGGVGIANQFGPDTLLLDSPIGLCVPTIKEEVQPLP